MRRSVTILLAVGAVVSVLLIVTQGQAGPGRPAGPAHSGGAGGGSTPPGNTAGPQIAGTVRQGGALTVSNGSWSGDVPTGYAYQWHNCSRGVCTNIRDATSGSYTLQASDVGKTIDATVTATNDVGSASATSAQTAAVTGSSSGCPSSTPNTPDGADPWGSCFPGPQTSGVPGNVTLVNVSSGIQPPNAALPSDNTGWTNSGGTIRLTSGNAVVDGIAANGVIIAGATGGTIENSEIKSNTEVDASRPVTFLRDSLFGGRDTNYDTIDAFGKAPLTITGDKISGGGHGILCYSNCTIENTYINNIAASAGAHQNPILFDGGSNNSVTHSTVHCTASNTCTSELSLLLNDGDQINETMEKNLIMSTTPGHAAYCVYPGPNYSSAPHQVSGITWEDNVIQKGTNGHCDSSYGEVYGWYPKTCSPNPCTWTGNVYDDGTVWNP